MSEGPVGEPAILGPDVDPTVLDTGGERDRESATTESVQFDQEVPSDMEVFRECRDLTFRIHGSQGGCS